MVLPDEAMMPDPYQDKGSHQGQMYEYVCQISCSIETGFNLCGW